MSGRRPPLSSKALSLFDSLDFGVAGVMVRRSKCLARAGDPIPISQALAEALKENKQVKSIDLENSKIGDVGAQAPLRVCLFLLFLIGCCWASETIPREKYKQALAEMLQKNKTIESIELCGNRITNFGAKAAFEQRSSVAF